MVISSAIHDSSEHLRSTFASRYVRTSLPRFQMQENSIPKEAAYQIINDELMLDGNPRLNLASFVTTWMEPECDKLIMNSINKNYVDMDEYPVTTELQNRCVNIIANLFNAPVGETETAIGVGTVGSSEAIMLAGLAFKRKWQQKRKLAGKPYDNPNIVTGANVQVCWEKFARYFEVELKEVKLTEGYYVMDPNKAVEMVDENTICVAAILGSTLTGEFEDVKLLNDLLTKKNEETGWDVPIHVDAASGGFIAPFLHPDLVWDFRLPLVKSINLQRNSVILCLFPKRKMVISSTVLDSSEHLHSTFASRYVRAALPKFEMPRNSIPKDAAYQIINDELMLDGNPRLNLASFVTTWMEPECDKLIMNSINKNYVDMDEYPVTTELQNRCVNIIANLFNAPVEANETAVGVGTVGSSEAIMLAGLAFKRNWQKKRRAEGKPTDNPNIVTGANVQVCWEKFARYFEVELKEVHLTEGYYVMNPEKAVEMVDENTICVAAILGSTLTGEFEDVKLLNDLLTKKNEETGWDIPIHVDAASGGFIAPFLHPELEWDFRLPLVKSINVSGHKYGLVYAGVGWVVWRTKDDLPDELVIRLGFEGYKNIMANCAMNAKLLREGLEKMKTFEILSKDIGVPLVAFSVKDSSKYTVFNISHALRKFGWIVPAYTMPADAQHIAVLRVVIREDFSCSLAERLLSDIDKVLKELEDDFSKKVATVAAVKKSDREIEELVVSHWKKFLEGKSKNVVC